MVRPLLHWVRIALLASLVLFGLQLLFPRTLQACDLPISLAEMGMAVDDLDDANDGVELDADLWCAAFHTAVLQVGSGSRAPRSFSAGPAVGNGLTLLLSGGLQPSAP